MLSCTAVVGADSRKWGRFGGICSRLGTLWLAGGTGPEDADRWVFYEECEFDNMAGRDLLGIVEQPTAQTHVIFSFLC